MKKLIVVSLSALLFTANAFALTGTVKSYNAAKGFGFITPSQGGKDIFFHYLDVKFVDQHRIDEGYCVDFNVEKSRSGEFKAVNVAINSHGDCAFEQQNSDR